MYRALYRKYRPTTFTSVVGQKDIINALQNQIAAGKSGHAYIFTGTRGTGKTSCAKIFAKALNCPNAENGNPCGVCEICKGVENDSLVDVIEIDAASNNGVDDMRNLREEAIYVPVIAKYKIYIIDEVHMLSNSAFNALLKTMEEPPSHVVFILATTEIHKVPVTILSRCQRYDFYRISAEDIKNRVLYVAKSENIDIEENAATLISHLADGAMRDALSILDTCASVNNKITEEVVQKLSGVTDKSYLFSFSQAIKKADVEETILLLAKVRIGCSDTKRIIEELISHYRNLLLAGVSKNNNLIGCSNEEYLQYVNESKILSKDDCINAIKRLSQCLFRISKGGDQRIELELALIDLCTAAFDEEIEPVNRVKKKPVPKNEENIEKVSKPENKADNKQGKENKDEDTNLNKFELWDTVVENISKKDISLKSFIRKCTAYEDGSNIILDGGAFVAMYLKNSPEVKVKIKEELLNVTNKEYNLLLKTEMPNQMQENKKQTENSAINTLKNLGVNVIEE